MTTETDTNKPIVANPPSLQQLYSQYEFHATNVLRLVRFIDGGLTNAAGRIVLNSKHRISAKYEQRLLAAVDELEQATLLLNRSARSAVRRLKDYTKED